MFVESMAAKPFRFIHATQVGYDGTAEIQGIPIGTDHYFRGVGIFQSFQRGIRTEWFYQCGDLCGGIVKTGFYSMQLRRLDKRFVSLYVDYYIEPLSYLYHCFVATVCSAFVVHGCHHYFSAECFYGSFDTFIVCGHVCIVKHTGHLLVHTLYHGFPSKHGQWLCRKPRRGITGRNDS